MKRTKRSRTLAAAALIGIGVLGAVSIADAQYRGYGMGGGGMMGGGMMGGGMMGGSGFGRGYDENRGQARRDLNSRKGQLYAQTCSQCHALPDPRQHTAEQWPGVVARMERYMRQRQLPLPDEAGIRDIDTFLRRHANGS